MEAKEYLNWHNLVDFASLIAFSTIRKEREFEQNKMKCLYISQFPDQNSHSNHQLLCMSNQFLLQGINL